MPMDFPSSPTVGQQYNGYVWTGTAWDSTSAQPISLSTTAPGYNYIINGAFDIWQRGTSFTNPNSTSAFNADRWIGFRGSLVSGMTISRQTAGLAGFSYCARVQRNSGDTSTQIMYFNANTIETVNAVALQGKTVTVSFYARVGANYSGGTSLQAVLTSGTGTDQNITSFTGAATVAAGTPAVTTSWQRFSYSGVFPSNGSEVKFELSYSPTGTAGANDYYEVTGVQLEEGGAATAFKRNAPSIQAELAACQRYYQRFVTGTIYGTIGSGWAYTTTNVILFTPLKTPMRAVPTTIEWTGLGVHDALGAQPSVSTLTINSTSITNDMGVTTATLSSAVTAGKSLFLGGSNSVTAYLGLGAEL